MLSRTNPSSASQRALDIALELGVVLVDAAHHFGKAQEVALHRHAENLEHGARPEYDALRHVPIPHAALTALQRLVEAVGGDGFAIRQGLWPGYVGPFVEQVIPLLQQRGVARAEYAGTTLREHLQEF